MANYYYNDEQHIQQLKQEIADLKKEISNMDYDYRMAKEDFERDRRRLTDSLNACREENRENQQS